MSWIIIVILGLAAAMLVFSLFKKLVKLAFTALALLLLATGIWYVWQHGDVEVPESVRQVGEKAAGKIGEVAGEALDRAAEVAKEQAEQAIDRAAEAAKEGADKVVEGAPETSAKPAEDSAGGNQAQKPASDPAGQD